MKQLLLACLLALSTTACTEAGDPEAPPAPDETVGDSRPNFFAADCGEGEITYYAWVCHSGVGWEQVEVGARITNCGTPHFGALHGIETNCSYASGNSCGGGPLRECTASSCPAHPTTYCYVRPPAPTPPPGPGPGNG